MRICGEINCMFVDIARIIFLLISLLLSGLERWQRVVKIHAARASRFISLA